MPKAPENQREFAALVKVVALLRGRDGCPWDKEQTHTSLARYAIEEVFELAEAIDSGDQKALIDELGDVLLQVVLHAEIARQESRFDIHDVVQNICAKMVRRHPHVFADVVAVDSAEVLRNWSAIKADEKKQSERQQPLSFDIPEAIPALLRSQKIGEKTKKFDFDWQSAVQCWPKVREEIDELEQAMNLPSTPHAVDRDAIEAEMGDVLFSIAQLARHLNLDAEQALRKTNRRFEARFHRMQETLRRESKAWDRMSAEAREGYWKRAAHSDDA